MAENSTRNVLCRFYLSNVCRDGSECRFSHDRTTGIVDNICRYYLKNECRYGSRCRYDHVRTSSAGNREVISRGKISRQNDLNQNRKAHACPTEASGTSGTSENISYANAVHTFTAEESEQRRLERLPLCEYHMISGVCPDRDCRCAHGEFCSGCNKYIIHPHNKDANAKHIKECEKQQAEQAVLTAAIARSATLSCGVCMDVVLEKEPATARRFGILSSCSHVFCIGCIRQWRQNTSLAVQTIRACPECRTSSDFVTPSAYFVEKGEEKAALIQGYKAALAQKDCKYFKKGRGTCPFARKCFYKHQLSDGTIFQERPRRFRTDQDEIIHQLNNALPEWLRTARTIESAFFDEEDFFDGDAFEDDDYDDDNDDFDDEHYFFEEVSDGRYLDDLDYHIDYE